LQIHCANLSVAVDGRSVVQDVSLTCAARTMTALVGASGSGKTTLLHALGLLVRPSAGTIEVDGADATAWSDAIRRRFWSKHAAFVLQGYGVIDDETVAFNVSMTLGPWGTSAGGDRARIAAALEQTGLTGREKERASHLSGGEKQRLGIARAIYRQTDVVYADEPTASLDAANREQVVTLLRERADAGAVVVIATHDETLAELCDARYALGDLAPLGATP
jgi:putative ABC transport system ATP-binding protein